MATYPTSFIRQALRQGLDAETALGRFRRAGGEIEDSAFLSAFGNVVAALAGREEQGLANLNRKPTQEEITVLPQTRGKGYLTQIEIQVMNKDLGIVENVFYGVRTRKLAGRAFTLQTAIADFQANAEQYGEDVLGGIITGVYELGG